MKLDYPTLPPDDAWERQRLTQLARQAPPIGCWSVRIFNRGRILVQAWCQLADAADSPKQRAAYHAEAKRIGDKLSARLWTRVLRETRRRTT